MGLGRKKAGAQQHNAAPQLLPCAKGALQEEVHSQAQAGSTSQAKRNKGSNEEAAATARTNTSASATPRYPQPLASLRPGNEAVHRQVVAAQDEQTSALHPRIPIMWLAPEEHSGIITKTHQLQPLAKPSYRASREWEWDECAPRQVYRQRRQGRPPMRHQRKANKAQQPCRTRIKNTRHVPSAMRPQWLYTVTASCE